MLSKKMATGGGISSEVQRLASHAQAFDSIPVQLQKDERKEGEMEGKRCDRRDKDPGTHYHSFRLALQQKSVLAV